MVLPDVDLVGLVTTPGSDMPTVLVALQDRLNILEVPPRAIAVHLERTPKA